MLLPNTLPSEDFGVGLRNGGLWTKRFEDNIVVIIQTNTAGYKPSNKINILAHIKLRRGFDMNPNLILYVQGQLGAIKKRIASLRQDPVVRLQVNLKADASIYAYEPPKPPSKLRAKPQTGTSALAEIRKMLQDDFQVVNYSRSLSLTPPGNIDGGAKILLAIGEININMQIGKV